jgi:Flp pilus assembly protein TadD
MRYERRSRRVRKGADNGHTDAMNNLGVLLKQRGELDEAETWHRRAADNGHTDAMNNLGVLLHERGELDEAETWHRRVDAAGGNA